MSGTGAQLRKILPFVPKNPPRECDGCRLFSGGLAYGRELCDGGRPLLVPVEIDECPVCHKPLEDTDR